MTATTTDVLTRAADVIEPYIEGKFKRRDRAEGNAQDLARAGILAGGNAKTNLPVQEQAANLLQCTQSWPVAERIAAELAEAGLLKDSEGS